MKPALFHPAARTAIRLFPGEVRREIGKAIFDLQRGERLGLPLARTMPSLAASVAELRIRDRAGIYRVFVRGILIFHAFMKRTQATSRHELVLARKRLKELLNEEI